MTIYTSMKSNTVVWTLRNVTILLLLLLSIIHSPLALSARNVGTGFPPDNDTNDPYDDIEPDFYGIHNTRYGFDWISFSIQTRPKTTNTLYVRQGDRGPWKYLRPVPSGYSSFREEGLDTHVKRCYSVRSHADSRYYVYQTCKSPYSRVEFRPGEMSQEITDRILDAFEWSKTEPVQEGNNPNQPALYSMAVLLEKAPNSEDENLIRDLGIHIQDLPLFPNEFPTWDSQKAVVTVGDEYRIWRFIVIPGYLYNAIRDRNITRESKGQQTSLLVFRRIPDNRATDNVYDPYRLNYSYLRDNLFTYNGNFNENAVNESGCQLDDSKTDCPLFIGSLIKHIVSYFSEGAEFLIDGVRKIQGFFKRKLGDEVTLTLNIQLLNTESNFTEPMKSGWSGELLTLEGATVQIRQGFSIFEKKINAYGNVTGKVAKHDSSKICFKLKNHAVEITELLTEKTVCLDGRYVINANTTLNLQVKHPYVNAFAGITDAYKYMEEVMDFKMRRVRVLTGWLANILAVDDDRSYAPCLGIVDLTTLDLIPLVNIVKETAELVMADIDIILSTKDAATRGVPVHEYGHNVLCTLAHDVNGDGYIEIAWTDVILGIFDQNASNSSWIFNEAFADFISSQVLGATNYVNQIGGTTIGTMSYANAGSGGIETNYRDSSNPTVRTEVARVASIIHDFFDGNVLNTDPFELNLNPNDGTHWDTVNNSLTWARSTKKSQINLKQDSDQEDEEVLIPGSSFTRWADFAKRHSFFSLTFNYKNWLGGLADLARDEGYNDAQICDLFALHSMGGTCPDY